METLLIPQPLVRSLLDPESLYDRLRAAFAAYSTSRTVSGQHVGSSLGVPAGASASLNFPGLLPGVPAYSVKVHAKFPGRSPAIRGILCLHDLASGALLAIMDSTYLTALRTGLTATLGADVLAARDAETIAIVGAGVQGEFQLRTIGLARRIGRAMIYDIEPGRAQALASRLESQVGFELVPCDSLSLATHAADIVVTATWARSPFLTRDLLKPGAHVTTLGPDAHGKAEVDARLIRESRFVCDDPDLATGVGALGGVGLGADAIHAELGEVIAGRKAGREHPDQITIFGSVGLAIQDLAAAWLVYERALATGAEVRRVNFMT